jgi:hypothetical protein
MLWQLFNLGKTWGCRPSELIGIRSDWQAFCFDRAVATFGNALQNELESVEGKNSKAIQRKRDQILRKWIPEAREERKFADPGKR